MLVLTIVLGNCIDLGAKAIDTISVTIDRRAIRGMISHDCSLGILLILLLFLKLLEALFFDTFDFLPHPQKLNHLFDINLSSDVLGDTKLVFLVHGSIQFGILILSKVLGVFLGKLFFLHFLLSLNKVVVDNRKCQVNKEKGANQYANDEE